MDLLQGNTEVDSEELQIKTNLSPIEIQQCLACLFDQQLIQIKTIQKGKPTYSLIKE